MPSALSRELDHPTLGSITLRKIRRARHIRLRILPNGKLQVTLPYLVSFQTALRYAESQQVWVQEHRIEQPDFMSGDRIGERYHFDFQPADLKKTSTRINGQRITVRYPLSLHSSDKTVQQAAHRAAVRALRAEAEETLPAKLRHIAVANDFNVKRIEIRQLRSRWGSCSSTGVITLNIFLLLLPEELIEYVLVHELAHTRQLNHSPAFWAIVAGILPQAKALRKSLHQYQPYLFSQT